MAYFGESGRTSYDRGLDHVKALNSGDQRNACTKHQGETHQGQPWDFSMSVAKSHKYPLNRQTHEGRLIEDFKGDEVLNQRGEWGCNLPPALDIEGKNEKKKVVGAPPNYRSGPPQAQIAWKMKRERRGETQIGRRVREKAIHHLPRGKEKKFREK